MGSLETRDLARLSPQQRAALEALLWQRRASRRPAGDQEAPPILPVAPAESGGPPPLSFAQQRLWFIDQLEPGSPLYNIPVALRVAGPLRPAVLARALTEIVRRHAALRTVFAAPQGSPVQVVRPPAPFALPVVDLSGLPASRREAQALLLAGEEAARPFDLGDFRRGPLLRGVLLRLGDPGDLGRDEHLVALTLHHIVSDGWSLGVLVREVAVLYPAFATGRPSPLPELPVQYTDFALWQHSWLHGEALERQISFWRRQLAGLPPLLELPADRPRPAVQSFAGSSRPVRLPAGLVRPIEALGQREGATLFMVLLAGFQILLARYSGQDDLAVGSPVAGRNRQEIEGLIGCFVNTLVLRGDLSGPPTFRELLGRVRETALAAHLHQDVPFEKVVEELAPERSLAYTPLFQAVLVLQNAPAGSLEIRDLRLWPLNGAVTTAKFDLTLNLTEHGGEVGGALEHATALFDAATVDRLTGHFERLLQAALDDPDQSVAELPLLSAGERHQVLAEWNDTAVERAESTLEPTLIHQPFEAWARRAPGAVAVAWRGEEITYGELGERAERLAGHLAQLGAGAGSLVGIHLRRGPGMIAAVLAVLKAGAAYVPLEVGHPPARLRWILGVLDVSCVVTETAQLETVQGLEAPGLRDVVCLDQLTGLSEDFSGGGAPLSGAGGAMGEGSGVRGPDDLAYIIFTSGSTGAPKGVMVRHRPVVNLLRWAHRAFAFSPADRVLFITSLSFDLSVFDIFGLLGAGGSIRIAGEEEIRDPERLLRVLAEEPVTFWDSAPAALEQTVPFLAPLRDGLDPQARPALRLVFLSGDWVPVTLPGRIRERFPGARVVALGGATEATVWSNVFPVERVEPSWSSIPYGRPIDNARYHVLDARLAPCPMGVPGDLYIGGDCLADGYAREPALTAHKFLPDPWGATPGSRLYRTGDRARHRPDGNLEFLGRLDQQVKIRGYRIELGEIETALATLPGVREAAVVVREERSDDGGRDRRLVAYVAGEAGEAGEIDAEALRRSLRESLPDYMVPSAFVLLAALPITPNGKVDRKALPAPRQGSAGEDDLAPRTPVEEVLAGIWAELLGAERVGAHDHFFNLGGHSLLAMQVISRLRGAFGVEMPVLDLFAAPVLAELAARVEGALRSGDARLAPPLVPLVPISRDGAFPTFPLSFAQQRLWLIDRLEPGSPLYNVPVALRVEGPLDAGVLDLCLGEILRRHEVLRTVFAVFEGLDGAPVQVVQPAAPFGLPVIDLAGLPEREREALALTLAGEEAGRPFDLVRGPVLRGALLRLAEGDHAVLLTLHHIASDAWAMGLLVREVAALYPAFAAHRPSPLPELPVQYGDFALWQRSWLRGEILEQEIAFWRRQLAGLPPLLELPTDRPRPAVQSFRGALRPVRLPIDLGRKAAALGRREGATLFMVLLAGFQALLARHSGQDDLAVGSAVAGRNRIETEGLIGFFVNTLVLRGDLAGAPGAPTFRELLGRARATALAAYLHQDVPFEKLVEELAPERSLSHAPLFQVMLVLQNAPFGSLEVRDLCLRPFSAAGTAAKFDLTLSLEERGGALGGTFEHAADLYDAVTIDRLAGHFERLLSSAVLDPGRTAADLPLLAPAELHQVRIEWNPALPTLPSPAISLVESFESWADRMPDAVAVLAPEESLTWAVLDRRANQLARSLRARGVTIDSRVGLCVERSPAMIVAVLGILKAGAAYVPLDPAYPRERLSFMIQEARLPVLLTEERLAGSLPENAAPVTLRLDADWPEIARAGGRRLPPEAVPESLAYVIFTSGSTGRPKGVMVHHRGWSHLADAQRRLFRVKPADRVLQLASLSFDASASEIAMALGAGSTLVLAPRERLLSREELTALLRGCTLATLPPTVLATLEPDELPGLDTLIVAGEACPPELARRWSAGRRFFNAYGPTEASVCATAHLYTGGERLPIGRPIERVQAYVLDGRGHPVPAGVVGELCAGGPGLARGYLSLPGRTAESFVPHPLATVPGERLYRTGDLARHLPGGELEFLGRLDHQVKIRGFRIELGEIEAALTALPEVREAAVVVREDAAGDRRLVAYVAGDLTGGAAEALREPLRERLPDYMVPAAFVRLPALPLTPNGKVDRKGLPAPDWNGGAEAFAAPRTPVEEVLAGIWAELLGRERIGATDSFFALGGHSLLATQVMSRLRRAFGVELPVRDLFEAPALADLAKRVEAARRHGAAPLAPPLVPMPREGPLPLSFAQQRLWLIDQLEPGNPLYNIAVALRVEGPLDGAVLARSLSELVRRHEVLRTTFAVSGGLRGAPVQVVQPARPFPLAVADLSGLPESRREAAALRLAGEEAVRPFDLGDFRRGPLLRGVLLRLAADDHTLALTLHHIASDGWSMGVLVREIAALYPAFADRRPSPLPELPVQYADFALWQRSWLQGDVLEGEIAFWRRQLAGLPPLLELPTDRPRPAVQSFRGATRPVRLPAALTRQAEALARHEGATLFMVLLAAFQTLLARLSRQDDLAVGSPVAGRSQLETEGLIGFFVNTLVLRGGLTGAAGPPTFREQLARVRETALAAWLHQDVPFERLVEELAPERSLAHTPLFQVALALQNAPVSRLEIERLRLRPVNVEGTTAKFDLTVSLAEHGGGLAGVAEYATDLFDAATVDRLLTGFAELLAAAVAGPEARAEELPLLSAAERHQLLLEWGGGRGGEEEPAPLAALSTLHGRFAARARLSPEAPALTCGGVTLTYGELHRRACRLARWLRRQGAGPESRVGLYLDRSVELVEGILGVLAAGAAYVPLDPGLPPERLAFVLADAGIRIVVGVESLAAALPGTVVQIRLDTERALLESLPAGDLGSPGDASSLAYVIYTSGSTGRPKGALITHGNAVRLFDATADWFRFGPGDVWTLFHSYAFDFSVWEIWGALLYGGRLVIVPWEASRSPELFLDLLERERVTVLNQTPSAFARLVHAEAEHGAASPAVSSLRLVIFGGEALDPASLEPWLSRHGDRRPRLINMYGITETTVHVTYRPLSAIDAAAEARTGHRSLIGTPIPDLSLAVMDRSLAPVPIGVPGELAVGGAGLARGYLGRPELTAERFVPDPAGGRRGARLYRSGDLGRFLPDGDVEYLGRLDHQVKIRGFRIELGEIEAALLALHGVREAVVLAREERSEAGSAGRRLVAYVAGDATAGALRQGLQARLPDYMVPAAFVTLAALPLTANGKVDRKALPAPGPPGSTESHGAPRTPVEETLAGIWAEVLGLERVGAADSFFELGGHSLLATQVMSRVRAAFGVELPLRALFEAPRLPDLAARIEATLRTSRTSRTSRAGAGRLAPPLEPIAPARRKDPLPLSFAQQRLWLIDQLEPGSPLYNVPVVLRVEGPLDPRALALCLGEIVRRHEALRTVFAVSAGVHGEPVQVIRPAVPFGLPVVDLSGLPESRREATALTLAGEEAGRPFDLAAGPLLRGVLLRLGEGDHAVALTMHHIVSDGWSMGILVREVAALYPELAEDTAGRLPPLPELPVQYADFAVWQRSWLHGEVLRQEISFWRRQLAGLPPLLELPTDRPRPALQSFRGASRPVRLPAALTRRMEALARREGATLFMVLLAGFQALLARTSGQDDLAVGSPAAGRDRVEIEGLIGFFVNTLVLRGDLTGNPTVRELLGRVRDTALAAWLHQDVPFEKLVEELAPQRSLAQTPLFQAMLALQNAPVGNLEIEGLRLRPMSSGGTAARFDLTVSLEEHGGELRGTADFAADLFDGATVERLVAHLLTLLEGLGAGPDRRLSELALLSPAEHAQLLASWTGPRLSPLWTGPVHDLLARAAERGPEAPALLFAGETVSYGALRRRVSSLAAHLAALGVGPETRVVLAVEPSPEMIAGLFGILEAGAAYVPLDPTAPPERLAHLLALVAETGETVVLTQERHRAAFAACGARVVRIVCLDATPPPDGDDEDTAPPPRGAAVPASAAYVIYTSGSTGTPKGVVASHGGLASFTRAMAATLRLEPGDRVLQFASLSFDASAVQIFPPLASGATLVLHPNPRSLAPAEILDLCVQTGVTVLDLPAALWRQWVTTLPVEALGRTAIRAYLTGGEAVPAAVLREWAARAAPGATFLSSYGPTEATVTTTAFETTQEGIAGLAGAEAPLGRPLPNTRLALLDAHGQTPPQGAPGEIYIGGAGVTRGYLHEPALTAERFVPDPLSQEPGARLYRTGDLARLLPNREGGEEGELEFLGRGDHQVKVRGFRIELGEIEAALAALPGVREAVVAVREERLVAYLVGDASADALRKALRQRLPDYMVPAAFVMLAALPLTPSGKVDRKALPAPERTHTAAGAYAAPRNTLEHAIAEVWQEVLGLDRVGREDNFFDAGGHSLLAIQVHARLRERLGRDLTVVDLFQYPTVQALAEHLSEDVDAPPAAVAAPLATLERPAAGIAVIGMAGRFPGAADVEELWANLRDGREAVVSFTDEEMRAAGVGPEMLAHPRYVKSGTVLAGIELFDAGFFGFSPREAEMMDPQHRLFLEASWQALEDAGYDPRGVPGRTGVWGGADMSSYMFHLLARPDLLQEAGAWAAGHGIDKDFLVTRVSYELDLRGPSVAVQTACSTSLVAVHHACRSLASGECDTALAGGVSVSTSQRAGYLYEEGGISSPDGHCRAFDARARGTISGSGAGVVVLKRLEDALRDGDTIRAVIRGTAINNDGSLKVGFTAPSVEGQAEVIATAQAAAGVPPASIGYVEAHGTGTPLGDPIEVAALIRAFRRSGVAPDPDTERQGFCGLGSIKTNIGHLGSAAGVAGLIKAVLALEHRQIPPSLHFETPNPAIDFAKSPFRVVDRLTGWEADGGPRRAGVSSFGIGGTNAHAVLEEAPSAEPSGSSRPYQLLLLSARTAGALEEATGNLATWLERYPEVPLADVAHTLRRGRHAFNHRRVLVCRDREDALQALESRDPQRLLTRVQEPARHRVVFLFPGGGAQHADMGLELYRQEPVFRGEVDRCLELLVPHLGFDLKPYLYPSLAEGAAGGALSRTSTALPALFVTEIALAKLWMSWGVRPQALIGHSLGEYAAAYLAGVLSLEDALAVVALRGRLFETLPEGAMLSVPLPEAEVLPLLAAGLSIAAINDAAQCVVSGPVEEIARLERELAGRGLEAHKLHIDVAAHSSLVEPILGEFGKLLRSLRLTPPRIPFLSDVTGTWIRDEEATDPGYWVRQLRHTVRFAAGLDTLLEEPRQVFLEMGPGRILSSFARRHPRKAGGHEIFTTLRHVKDPVSDLEFTVHLLGRLWLAGVEIDWRAFQGEEKRRRVPLPTYPFQRRRFWVEPPGRGLTAGAAAVDPRRFLAMGGGEPVRPAADFGSLLRDPRNAELLQRLLDAEPDLRVLLPVLPEAGTAPEPGAPDAPSRPAAGHLRPELPIPYCEPQNEIERRLATIWGNLLGIDQVGVHDDFFELGGHSVLATRVLSRIREELGREIPLAAIFEAPTVAKLAAQLAAGEAAGGEPASPQAAPILPAPRTGDLPLSFAQQRLWFIHQLEPGSPIYNLQTVLRVEGPLHAAVLARTLGEIVRRHEALRTVFAAPEGSPVQVIQPAAPFPLPLVDLAALPESRREPEVLLLAGGEAARPFDLTRGPLLRGLLLRLAGEDHAISLTTHHIASDGWSVGILIREVTALYPAFLEGKPSPLPELRLQYADFAVWQRGRLDGHALERLAEHWRRRLAGAPPQLDLPGARPRPAVLSPRGAARQRRFSPSLMEQLRALGRRESATLFMTLLAPLQALLHARTGATDLVVGTDVAGRDRREIEGLIGFFINQLPLRTQLAGDPTLRELLERVRETALEAYAHQDLPFDHLVEALRTEQSLRRSPVFQVKLVLQNIPREEMDLPGLSFRVVPPRTETAQLDLHWSFLENGGELWLTLTYGTDLFDEPLIDSLLDQFEMWLHAFAERPEARLGAVAAELARAGQDRLAARGLEIKAKNLGKLRRRRVEELVGVEHDRAD